MSKGILKACRKLLRRPGATASTRMLSNTMLAQYLSFLILFAVGTVLFYFFMYFVFSSIRV